MAIPAAEIEVAIRSAFPTARFTLRDTVGDQDHYDLTIGAPELQNLSRIAQHRAIYSALQERLSDMPHALSIKIEPMGETQ